MNSDAKGEQSLGKEIDAIFSESYAKTKKGRIELAAYAISACVNQLDALRDQQRKSHESVGSASRFDVSLYSIGYAAMLVPMMLPDTEKSEATGVERIIELFDEDDMEHPTTFDPIEKATLALQAAIDGIRVAHNLTWWQTKRAIAMSRKQLR